MPGVVCALEQRARNPALDTDVQVVLIKGRIELKGKILPGGKQMERIIAMGFF